MKVVITKQGLTYCGTNPTKHNVAKSDVEIFFIFYDPHISLKPSKYQGKNTDLCCKLLSIEIS